MRTNQKEYPHRNILPSYIELTSLHIIFTQYTDTLPICHDTSHVEWETKAVDKPTKWRNTWDNHQHHSARHHAISQVAHLPYKFRLIASVSAILRTCPVDCCLLNVVSVWKVVSFTTSVEFVQSAASSKIVIFKFREKTWCVSDSWYFSTLTHVESRLSILTP